jgi:hypothetical protein
MSEVANGNPTGNSAPAGNVTSPSPSGYSSGGQPSGGQQGPWYSSFASGLEGPDAEAFSSYASRYQDPSSFAKGFVNLRKSFDSRIPLPGPDADESQWGEIYDKLGRPSDPTQYQFNHLQDAPELADIEVEARENFRGVAHRLGLTQKQIDGLTQWNDSFRKTQYEAFENAPKYAAEKAKEVLTKKYGPDRDRNLNVYRNTAKQYFGEDLDAASRLRLDDGSFALDHPAIVDAFIRIGLERQEDQRGIPMLSSGERESVMSQIQQIEQEAIQNRKSTAEEPYYSRLRNLYQKLEGKGKIGANSVFSG